LFYLGISKRGSEAISRSKKYSLHYEKFGHRESNSRTSDLPKDEGGVPNTMSDSIYIILKVYSKQAQFLVKIETGGEEKGSTSHIRPVDDLIGGPGPKFEPHRLAVGAVVTNVIWKHC
jgi:hypothetical protein